MVKLRIDEILKRDLLDAGLPGLALAPGADLPPPDQDDAVPRNEHALNVGTARPEDLAFVLREVRSAAGLEVQAFPDAERDAIHKAHEVVADTAAAVLGLHDPVAQVAEVLRRSLPGVCLSHRRARVV